MSLKYLSAVWHGDLEIDHTELVVLLSLADQANDDGWSWPSNQTTADRCRLHRDTVLDIIRRLEERGYVDVKRRPGKSSYYRLTLPEPTAQDRTYLRSTAVPPTAQDRRTYGPHSRGTVNNRKEPPQLPPSHDRERSAQLLDELRQAKGKAVPMPDHLRRAL